MSITPDELKNLAALARLPLSDEEIPAFQKDMDAILAYVAEINAVSSSDSEDAVVSVPEHHNVWRDDADANESGHYTEALLANAPAREGDYVKVKKIL